VAFLACLVFHHPALVVLQLHNSFILLLGTCQYLGLSLVIYISWNSVLETFTPPHTTHIYTHTHTNSNLQKRERKNCICRVGLTHATEVRIKKVTVMTRVSFLVNNLNSVESTYLLWDMIPFNIIVVY
jgi:hypothetical protein